MEYKDINDYELLYLVQERDEVAYNTIYAKYKPLISKMAWEYYKRNRDIGIEYDDLFQEGILSLENAMANYCEKSSLFYTFACICIKRDMEKVVKAARRYKHSILNESFSINKPMSENEDLYLEDLLYDEHYNIAENYISDYNCTLLNKDFKYTLPDEYALVFELKTNNFSNLEISKLLDLDYKMVDNILRSIKMRLKKYKKEIEEL